MALVDVVIPVYQRANLAREAVASVMAQSLSDITITVVEDGIIAHSEQNFESVATEFAADKRFNHIVLVDNSGPSYARNYGARLGHAPFVAFLDSDDLWRPEKLFLQTRYMQEHEQIQWSHTNEVWFKNGIEILQKREHRKQGGYLFERLLKRCLISPSAVIFRRPFWEKHGQFPEAFRVAEDYTLWLKLNYRYEVGYLEQPLTIKRAGPWQQLSATTGIDHYRVLGIHKFLRENRKDTNFSRVSVQLFDESIRKINLLIKGAQKYQNRRISVYQRWLALFTTLRTRAMSLSSEGIERNSAE